MNRRLSAALLVLLLLAPDAAAASGGGEEESGVLGGRLFWSALTLVNGVILASSVSDMRLYQDRARETAAAGGDAGEYWDASSREKVMVGLSAASLLVSLAGLKKTLSGGSDRKGRAAEETPFPTPAPPASEIGTFEVLSFEQSVRYDTLRAPGLSASQPALTGGEETDDGATADPLDVAFRRALIGASPGFSPERGGAEDRPHRAAEESAAASGPAPFADEPPSGGPGDWTVDAGSEWEAVLAARREAGIPSVGAPPRKNTPPERWGTPSLSEPVPVDSSFAGDPVEDLLLALATEKTEPAASREEEGVEAHEPPASPHAPPPAEETGPADFALLPWTVHVSSFRTFERAETDEAVWTARGEKVVIEEAEIPGRGIWFRVLVGSFAGREEAEAYAAAIRERHGLEYVQTRRLSGF